MSNETYIRCEREQLFRLLKDARHLITRLTPFSVEETDQILSEAIESVAANADAVGARIDLALKAVDGLRKVTNAGVRINGDFYNCFALQVGSTVRVKLDADGADRAHIYSAEDGGYLGEAPKVVSASSPDLLDAINDYVSWVRRNDATIASRSTPSDSEIDIEAEAWSNVKNLLSQAASSPPPSTRTVGIDQPQNHDNLQSETRSDPSSGDPEYGGADPRALKHDTSQAFPLPTSSPRMVGHKTPEYAAAQAGFADYFLRNYPSDTVIFDPSWHAPKLFYAAFRTLAAVAQTGWRPIAEADRSIAAVQTFPDVSITLRTSYPVWVRDEDGRVYEAVWSEGTANYWWDLEGESPIDPVEFMPHPLAAPTATTEGHADV